jgi:hypothetical protein
MPSLPECLAPCFRRIQLSDAAWDRFGSPMQREIAVVYIRAIIALFGSMLMWTGSWDLLTEGRINHRHGTVTPVVVFHVPLTHLQRTLIYLCVGWVFCVWADNITWQAGMWSQMWHPKIWGVGTRFERIGYLCRLVVGFLGAQVLWIGTNDLPDYYMGPPSTLKNALLVVLGSGVIFLTGTYEHMSFVFSENTWDEDVLTYRSSFRARMREIGRSTVSVFAQSAIWLGVWNFMGLDNFYTSDRSVMYLLMFFFLGFLIMIATGVIVGSSWIDTEFVESSFISRSPTFLLVVRAYASITGYVCYLNSAWILADVYLYENSTPRNLVYFFGGAFLCFVAGSLEGNILMDVELVENPLLIRSYEGENVLERIEGVETTRKKKTGLVDKSKSASTVDTDEQRSLLSVN